MKFSGPTVEFTSTARRVDTFLSAIIGAVIDWSDPHELLASTRCCHGIVTRRGLRHDPERRSRSRGCGEPHLCPRSNVAACAMTSLPFPCLFRSAQESSGSQVARTQQPRFQ
jgi:hypothetical protein